MNKKLVEKLSTLVSKMDQMKLMASLIPKLKMPDLVYLNEKINEEIEKRGKKE